MKNLLIKIVKFFKVDGTAKYVVQILIFSLAIVGFVILTAQDITGGIIETIIGFLFSALFLYIFRIIVNQLEDKLKINYDTEDLLRIYNGGKDYKKELFFNGTKAEFAYAATLVNDNFRFEIKDDPEKMFELDDFIMGNYETLFSAHTNSTKINDITVRLDKYEEKDGVYTLHLSRSTYFNHLVTNRAMDFILFEDISLRKVYEFGPLISSYEKSKMSNHVGVNALVFLSDGNLLVPRRKKDSTISKNKITSSIAVKLNVPKTESGKIDEDYFFKQTIMDNLSARTKIKPKYLSSENIEIDFLGFGQNLYEGGKPQFYYAVYLHDIDTEKYFMFEKEQDDFVKLDVDKCIYVADYASFRFEKNRISFDSVWQDGKHKRMVFGYEMSYLCNLWHYEEKQKNKHENDKIMKNNNLSN